jgi:fructokinase
MSKTKAPRLYGGIEAGGTKFVCAIGTGPGNIVSSTQFPTTTPEETLGKTISFFKNAMQKIPLAAIGIASFGPLDLDKKSSAYGRITNTPKSGWANTNLVKIIHDALGILVTLDTDVNGAALGEQKWGAAKGLDNFLYITVGTGIGGGGVINGKMLHGLVHPEMGHILVPHDFKKDPFPGCCPYHRDCLEGLASGTALVKRWGKPPEELPAEHPAWELEAEYLAGGIMNYICTLSPQKIIIGGGIMKAPGLLNSVRRRVRNLLNDYVNSPAITKHIDSYIVLPALEDMAGVLGAIALAQQDMGTR